MKKFIYLSAILMAVSCTTKLTLPKEPQVTQGISAVTVTIPSIELVDDATSKVIPGEGAHRWSKRESLGILSDNGTNAKFILRKSYDGKACESAEFYGEPQGGKLIGYLPWSENPVLKDNQEQKYFADAYAHFMNNTLLTGEILDSHLDLAYSGGLLKLRCNENIGLVESVRIYTNDWEAVVNDIDIACSASSPLNVWVKIPAGTYANFNVTFNCAATKVSIPAPGNFKVADFHCVDVSVKQQTYHDGIDPFTGEEGGYTEKPEDY